jgi:hypothetical protein
LAVLVNSKEAAAAEAAVASARTLQATSARTDRRFSILQAASSNDQLLEEFDLGDVLASSASDLLRDLGSGRVTAAPALKETIRMMRNGHPAVRYFADDETGAVASAEIFLWYVPPPPSASPQQQGQKVAGTLCWGTRAGDRVRDESATLDLRRLKTVLLKKNTPVFQSAALASVNKHRCFSLQASAADENSLPVELNLSMDSPEQVSAWLFGIYALVSRGGMRCWTSQSSAAGSLVFVSSDCAQLQPRLRSEIDSKFTNFSQSQFDSTRRQHLKRACCAAVCGRAHAAATASSSVDVDVHEADPEND